MRFAAWPVTVGSDENTVIAVRRTFVALGVTRDQLTFPDPTQDPASARSSAMI